VVSQFSVRQWVKKNCPTKFSSSMQMVRTSICHSSQAHSELFQAEPFSFRHLRIDSRELSQLNDEKTELLMGHPKYLVKVTNFKLLIRDVQIKPSCCA